MNIAAGNNAADLEATAAEKIGAGLLN